MQFCQECHGNDVCLSQCINQVLICLILDWVHLEHLVRVVSVQFYGKLLLFIRWDFDTTVFLFLTGGNSYEYWSASAAAALERWITGIENWLSKCRSTGRVCFTMYLHFEIWTFQNVNIWTDEKFMLFVNLY